jgi:hypothetical protein
LPSFCFNLEIHYDNPQVKEGIVDNSGIGFYYSNSMREHELGIVQIGDPGVLLENQSLPEGLSQYSFDCPASCTRTVLQRNVTVLREFMHMHSSGEVMKLEQIRDGEVIHTGQVDFHRYLQQGNHQIQEEPYVVQSGDSFRTVCNYNTRGVATKFGWGARDEMCIAFMFYYPKQSFLGVAPWFCDPNPEFGFSPCLSTFESTVIEELPRNFGKPMTEECVEPEAGTSGASSTALFGRGLLLTGMLVFAGWFEL